MRDVSGAQVGVGINGAGHAAVDGGKLSEDISQQEKRGVPLRSG